MANTKYTLSWILILSTVIAVALGIRCRVDNDSQSVEEFEDMVRICLRSSISPTDKNKNKQAWNNKNNSRGNRGKNKKTNNGRFGGKDSDEEDDDYDDDYGEEDDKNKDKNKDNKGNKNNNENKAGDSGGSKISSRFRRSPQYGGGRNYGGGRGYGNTGYGNMDDSTSNEQNPQMDMRGYGRSQQGGYGSSGGYGFYRDSYSNNYMNRDNMNRGRNYNYNRGADYDENNGNYKTGRYTRSAQYQQDNRWNDDRQKGQGMQGSQSGMQYGNRGGNRGGYDQYGNNGGSYGNTGGYGQNGGYDNRWSSSNYQPGKGNRNSTMGKSALSQVQPCLIHCILRQKRMLDDDNAPDKRAVMNVMTQNIKERELKEFIQDSINECFDNIESDDIDGKCDMSKSLMVCLEEKGKQNCEDWDRTGPSTNPEKWFNNNNGNGRNPNQQRQPAWG